MHIAMAFKGGCKCRSRRRALALLCALAISQALGAAVAPPAAMEHHIKGEPCSACLINGTAPATAPAAAAAAPAGNASAAVEIDLAHRQPTSPLLYGIFFEEARGGAH